MRKRYGFFVGHLDRESTFLLTKQVA
jgi:hypothetical protein